MITETSMPVPGLVHVSQTIALQCPQCGSDFASSTPSEFFCAVCGFNMPQEHGIWRAIPPKRLAYYEQFIRDYESIRAAEGRGSLTADYYLNLPFHDTTGRNSNQWPIRANTFQYLLRYVLPHCSLHAQPLRILDVGAGNGWMSYRLAEEGFLTVAVDLLTNNNDGLGAAWHYRGILPSLFPRFQAENKRLPFADGQFDAVIFNASFHYSEDYFESLGEALRCTRPGGLVIIADSPWYRKASSGEQMLAERRSGFLKRFGTESKSIASLEYLTDERLHELEARFNIRWACHTPFYGVRWALRPLVAKLRRRREPSRFRIYCARKAA